MFLWFDDKIHAGVDDVIFQRVVYLADAPMMKKVIPAIKRTVALLKSFLSRGPRFASIDRDVPLQALFLKPITPKQQQHATNDKSPAHNNIS